MKELKNQMIHTKDGETLTIPEYIRKTVKDCIVEASSHDFRENCLRCRWKTLDGLSVCCSANDSKRVEYPGEHKACFIPLEEDVYKHALVAIIEGRLRK